MSGIEELLAAVAAAATAAAPEAAAGATAAGATGAAAGAAAAGGAAAAAAGGLTTLGALELGSAALGLAGSGAQLLADKPKAPVIPPVASRDEAQRLADLESETYKRRGRGTTLLTAGKAQGDTSTPSLGAAALLGS
jgi:hypothetical protein